MTLELRSDRRDRFDVSPEQLWARLGAVDEYRSWWPWLRECDARSLEVGEVWRCAVQAPLSYRLHFALLLDEVEEGRSVGATVSGDIVGSARFEISADGSGSILRLVSALSPHAAVLQALTVVARPVAQRSHDWVLRTGIRQLREQL